MVPFVGGSYELKRKKADVQRTINMCPTPVESGSGKSPLFLQSIPGLDVFSPYCAPPVLAITRQSLDNYAAQLTWTTSNTTTLTISDGTTTTVIALNGTMTVTPAVTTTYTFVATCDCGTLTKQVTVQGEGLLVHFESLSAGKVVSAIGPFLAITAPNALSTTHVKFGASSGGTDLNGSAQYNAIGVRGPLNNRSWRVEGFFYTTGAASGAGSGNGEFFTVRSTTNNFFFTLYHDASISAYRYTTTNNAISGGGSLGTTAQAPPNGTWNHIALQYNATNGNLSVYSNGARVNSIVTLANMWNGASTFDVVSIMRAEQGWVDDFYFHFDPPVMYGLTYVIPAQAFLPPDFETV